MDLPPCLLDAWGSSICFTCDTDTFSSSVLEWSSNGSRSRPEGNIQNHQNPCMFEEFGVPAFLSVKGGCPACHCGTWENPRHLGWATDPDAVAEAPCWLALPPGRAARCVDQRPGFYPTINQIGLATSNDQDHFWIDLSLQNLTGNVEDISESSHERIKPVEAPLSTIPCCAQILQRKMRRGKHELAPGDYCNYKMRKVGRSMGWGVQCETLDAEDATSVQGRTKRCWVLLEDWSVPSSRCV